jgi:hypothetical protein
MFVGLLNNIKETSFTHKGTSVPFPPSSVDGNVNTWAWRYTYDSALDANYTLDKECFIGAVSFEINERCITKAEVLVDGKVSGMYSAETGKLFGGAVTVPVGVKGTSVTLRFYTSLMDLSLYSVEILGAYDDEKPLVWPTPKNIEYLGGFSKIKSITARTRGEDEKFAAEFLKERLAENLGKIPKSAEGVRIVFVKNTKSAYKGERYTITTEGDLITVTASSRLTLLYGADTILQLTCAEGVRKFNCDDAPTKEFRGFHAGIPHLSQFDFMRRFFRYVLLPLRYNTVFVQITAAMRFDSHPEINEAWEKAVKNAEAGLQPKVPHAELLAEGDVLEKEDINRYIGYARELGFDIVPEVQSLGHVQYITMAHPELAEIEEKDVTVEDTRAEDARPASFYKHCYCPSLEESYKIIFDLIDEIVETVKPKKYVHIGHDEIYQIGVCKRCRQKNPADLYCEHVTRLHDHLKEKGLGTMMWSDMIQPPPARPYLTYTAADRLPKDIIMLDFVWYFDGNLDHDIEDNILAHGFKVGVGNLYSSHYRRYKSRIMKEGMIGGQISTWVTLSENIFGNNGKMWDCIFLAEMLWNVEGYDPRNRRTYSHIIASRLQPKMRDNIRDKHQPKGYRETRVAMPKSESAVPAEVKALCPKAIVMAGESIKVGKAYDRLVFEHATLHSAPRIVWVPFEKIGDYIVTYDDRTVEEIPIKYAENIMAYDTAYGEPMPQSFYRHNGYVGTWFADPTYQGKDKYGSDITVNGFLWENPNPKKVISSVEYRPIEGDYCGLILAGIRGLKK